MAIDTIRWQRGAVRIIDQTQLPQRCVYLNCRDVKTLWQAIRRLSVRGAPALGVAAGFGVLLGAKDFKGSDPERFRAHIHRTCDYLATSRPTAVNLFYVLDQMRKVLDASPAATVAQLRQALQDRAMAIYEEDRSVCRQMGQYGAVLIKPGARVLTVCNAGALATVDYGTALGVMYAAHDQGTRFQVYACETRPLLQGARLTAWELMRSGIDTTLICDNMAASLMGSGQVDIIFAGADRIAANGDTANKIGTYSLAVLAQYHKVPFYIVAPRSTFDRSIKSGAKIPIEQRSADEVTRLAGQVTAPKGVQVYNPAFDVTPHRLIHGIVTECGIIRPPFGTSIRRVL